jgi:hypothetical protein
MLTWRSYFLGSIALLYIFANLCSIGLNRIRLDFFFFSTGFWTQALEIARQYSTAWAINQALFYFLAIFQIGFHAWGWPQTMNLLPMASPHIAVITGSHYYTQLIDWDGVSLTFFPGWSWTKVLPISASQVARIIGVSYHTQPLAEFLY